MLLINKQNAFTSGYNSYKEPLAFYILTAEALSLGIMKGDVAMRYSFTGKGVTVGDALKQKTIDKIGRLERLLPDEAEIFITFTTIKNENKIEATIPLNRGILRAEESDIDMHVALDKVVDVLEKQMVKYKGRLNRKAKRDPDFKAGLNAYFAQVESLDDDIDDEEANGGIVIKRSKKFALKPMDAEEAVMNMELLGHSFFVFRNAQTDEVNVVYRRNDNAYGLIEPEY